MSRLTAVCLFLAPTLVGQEAPPRRVVVASKPFAESYLLAEMFALTLEARGVGVVRRPGLGATEIAFAALVEGEIDVYPEYTGTGLLAILGEDPPADRGAAFRRVSNEFRRRWGLRWLPPLGFENTYAVAVRQSTADSLGLESLSDLAIHGPGLVGGLSPDFIGRADGLEGLAAAYDLRLKEVRPLLQAVKYRALAAGEVDVIDGYSTDGQIARYPLKVLADDRRFFPPYQAAALVGARLAAEGPEAVTALTQLSGLISEERIRRWNRRLEVEGDPVGLVAREALEELGIVEPAGDAAQRLPEARDSSSLWGFLWNRRGETLRLALRHLLLVGLSMISGILVAVPAGLLLEGRRGHAEAVIRAMGLLQTVPSIALLAFMIPILGIGVAPAVVALFLYSLYPIVRNTYTGVRDADPLAVEAARALGMTDRQLLLQVRLPLSAPVIMAGIRTAAVINVGTATLAAFIGAGGLGDPIVQGLALTDTRLVLSGAIPAAILALVVDAVLGSLERGITPEGIEG